MTMLYMPKRGKKKFTIKLFTKLFCILEGPLGSTKDLTTITRVKIRYVLEKEKKRGKKTHQRYTNSFVFRKVQGGPWTF